jgi:DtxR family Mn-dependent transcriptional regulator
MANNHEFYTVRGYQLLGREKKHLTSAMEDYLEMIYRSSIKEGYVRINVLSDMLNVRPSSATKMVQKLASLGLLDYKKYGIVFLTSYGRELGEFLLKRHNIIEKFLKNIGIEENILKETELIEHNVSANTLRNIEILNNFIDENPEFVEKLREYKLDRL